MSLPGFIGKKCGMTTVFGEDGNALPVTVIELLPLTVTQIKTAGHNGYSAVQVGFEPAKEKHLTRPEQGHLKKNNLALLRHLKEFRLDEVTLAALNVGETIDPLGEGTFLTPGTRVNVTGRSIGKGFQGGTKKWHFGRGPMSHGSKSHRLPGSIGAGTTPGRVVLGKRMARQMGNEQITVKNLPIVRAFPDKGVVLIRGAVPGVEGGLITISRREQ